MGDVRSVIFRCLWEFSKALGRDPFRALVMRLGFQRIRIIMREKEILRKKMYIIAL